ncbi:MAG: hypothetical protein D6811_06680 [Alphaproteobacteria bacterium]|nr:MAG: hypothetical protein D6811_06680 [Alphaproteobacteria bacterium]
MLDTARTAHARYDGEEIQAEFQAIAVPDGDPATPAWAWDLEPGTIEVTGLWILGVPVKLEDLPEQLRREIEALAAEVEFERE